MSGWSRLLQALAAVGFCVLVLRLPGPVGASTAWGTIAGILVFLVAVRYVAGSLRGMPRGVALLVALLGAVTMAGFSWSIYDDLRGERQDPGPEPARVGDLPTFATSRKDRTMPPPHPGPLRLLVWGDCRSGVSVQERLVAEMTRRQPDLCVGLGDLVGMARVHAFRILSERLSPADVITLVVPGNHDLDPFGTLKPYARVFGPPNWVLPFRGVLLLGLDTARGVVDPADVDWLEREIAKRAPDIKHTLLFCHHPLYTPEKHPEKPLPDDAATTRLRALVEREGISVFCSHYHGYDVQRHGTVLQVTTGGAGARPEGDDPYHFVWVEIGDDVRFEQVVLAQQSEISATWDRVLTFRDEALWAAGEFGIRTWLATLGLALFLGGLVGAAWPGRQRGVAVPTTRSST